MSDNLFVLLGKHLTLALKYSMFQLSWSLRKENHVAQYTVLVTVGFHSQSVLGPLLGCGDSFCRVFTSVLHKWHRVSLWFCIDIYHSWPTYLRLRHLIYRLHYAGSSWCTAVIQSVRCLFSTWRYSSLVVHSVMML